ncbi:MAG TPA: hypothetical protein VMV81_07395 [Phycisphaerae bacterium]|nr:hypothetical protein [Phycisphaerae bacterium]
MVRRTYQSFCMPLAFIGAVISVCGMSGNGCPNGTNPTTGSCCVGGAGGTCDVRSLDDCRAIGGFYGGDNTDCTTVPCGTSGNSQRRGIYVTNYGNNSVTVYSLDATGDTAPIRTIIGPTTGLSGPIGIDKDTQSHIYVANRSGGTVGVFDVLANGDTAPARVLTDANMTGPEGIVIAPGDDVFVSDANGNGVFHFPNNATASDFNISGSNTQMGFADGVALDSTRNLYVANAFGGIVGVFAPGTVGNQLPIRSFNPGGNTQGIAVGNNAVLISTGTGGIDQYPETATGNPTPSGNLLPSGLSYSGGMFFDTSVTPPILYVVDYSGNAVFIIQTAGLAPFLTVDSFKVIQGGTTGIDSPVGITVVK